MWDELIYVVFFGVHLDTLFQTTCVDWVKICTLNNPKWKPTMIRQIVVVIDELVEFEGVATSVWKHQFQMRRLEMELPSWLSQGQKHFSLKCASLQGVWFKVSPLFFSQNCPFPTPVEKKSFKPCKTTILDRSWTFIPNKRRTNLETKLLKIRHICEGWNFSALAYQTPFQNQYFSKVCGLHMRSDWLKFKTTWKSLIILEESMKYTSN